MQDINLYMKQLIGNATGDSLCEAVKKIPSEIGRIDIHKRKFDNGTFYSDWDMSFENSMSLLRRGGFTKDEVQIIFSMSHDVSWYIKEDGRRVKLNKGEVCIIRNIEFSSSMDYAAKYNYKFKSIQIPTEYFNKIMSRYFDSKLIRKMDSMFLRDVSKTIISPKMYKILYEMDKCDEYGEFGSLYLDAKIVEILSIILNDILHKKELSHNCKINLSSEEIEKISFIKRSIDMNPSEDIGCDEFAEDANISTTKLSKGFSSLYGISIHKYVVNKRLEYAAMLLSRGEFNVSEAALESGYSNFSHFSNSFRKKYGMLPKDYAKKN